MPYCKPSCIPLCAERVTVTAAAPAAVDRPLRLRRFNDRGFSRQHLVCTEPNYTTLSRLVALCGRLGVEAYRRQKAAREKGGGATAVQRDSARRDSARIEDNPADWPPVRNNRGSAHFETERAAREEWMCSVGLAQQCSARTVPESHDTLQKCSARNNLGAMRVDAERTARDNWKCNGGSWRQCSSGTMPMELFASLTKSWR